jgi:hypothetical protein
MRGTQNLNLTLSTSLLSALFLSACSGGSSPVRSQATTTEQLPQISATTQPSENNSEPTPEIRTLPTIRPLPAPTPTASPSAIPSPSPSPIIPPILGPIVLPPVTTPPLPPWWPAPRPRPSTSPVAKASPTPSPSPLPSPSPSPSPDAALLSCLETPVKTLEAYAKKPSLDALSHFAGCGILRSSLTENFLSDAAERGRLERLTILDLASRLIQLPSVESETLLKVKKESILARISKEMKMKGSFRQADLPFKRRDAIVDTFEKIVRKLPGPKALIQASDFPAGNFSWEKDEELLKTHRIDQFYYKLLGEWTMVRMVNVDPRTPKDFAAIAQTTMIDVNREEARLASGEPLPPSAPTKLDSQIQPLIPFRLVDEPTYLIVPEGNAGLTERFTAGSYSAIFMDLWLANRFQEIQPDLKKRFGVKTMLTMGVYNHRFIGGKTTFSRHAYGTAIDLSGFEFTDGKKSTVLAAYKAGGEMKNRFEEIRAYFKLKFNVVLGPGDAGHDDHFHVDLDPKKRPGHYNLSSNFNPLVSLTKWINLQNWFYRGTPNFGNSGSQQGQVLAVLPDFISERVREMELRHHHSEVMTEEELEAEAAPSFRLDSQASSCGD